MEIESEVLKEGLVPVSVGAVGSGLGTADVGTRTVHIRGFGTVTVEAEMFNVATLSQKKAS